MVAGTKRDAAPGEAAEECCPRRKRALLHLDHLARSAVQNWHGNSCAFCCAHAYVRAGSEEEHHQLRLHPAVTPRDDKELARRSQPARRSTGSGVLSECFCSAFVWRKAKPCYGPMVLGRDLSSL
jgi:hypothetical protein